jgi:hypothetical protein
MKQKDRSKLFCVGYLVAAMAMLLFVLTMAACDSNGGSSGGGGAGANAARQGIVVDDEIEGLEYETPTYSGLTDRSGRFQYAEGETVSFFIGDLLIGEARAKGVISPLDLVPDAADETHPAVINMARLLQTMDRNANSYNGIKITDSSRKLLAGFHSIDFDQSADDFSNDPDVQALLDILYKGGVFGRKKRMLYDADTALRHLRYTLQEHPSITIKAPNGGEELMTGKECEITWKAVSFIKNVAILVSTDGGATWNEPPITDSTPNDGSYTWDAVPTALKSTQCRFRIADADAIAEDESIAAASARVVHDDTDKDFTIHLTKGTVTDLIQSSMADDSDDDGLPDDVEQLLGTSPDNRDSDNDGVSDFDEIFGGTGYRPDQPLADQDNDGIIAALDPDENQKPIYEGFDRDGDGLTDAQEIKGWENWPDRYGLGLGTDTFGQMDAHYKVTCDPDIADTDGDGLDDYIEYLILSDPRKIDTDEDGLTDAEEHIRWHTSPSSVDTDGDSRGPGGDLAQNMSLFDGRELFSEDELAKAPGTRTLRMDATSPTLDDTDGDGVTDYEEYLHPYRSALIADLPKVEIKMEDLLDIRLDVEYAEEKGTEFQYGETVTESEEDRFMHHHSGSITGTIGGEFGVEAKGGVSFFGPDGETTVEKRFKWEVAVGYTGGVEFEKTTGWQEEHSEYITDSQTYTETAAVGSMTAGLRISNPGDISYHLDNLTLTVRYFERSIDPETSELQGNFKTLATLKPVFENGVTLAPGIATPVLQVAAEEVNADRIKMFLAQPSSLTLEPAYFDLETADGLNYAFIEEVTQSRTASVSIDFGDGEFEQYRFATNVDRRPDGSFAGVNLYRFLTESLDIPIETAMWEDDEGDPIATVPDKIRNLPDGGSDSSVFWIVRGTGAAFEDEPEDFEDIVLYAGDQVKLILLKDSDEDGISNLGEFVLGTSDDKGDTDTDSDGITDFEEAKGFAEDDGTFVPAGWTVKVRNKAPYDVVSDPRAADADGDGLNDLKERGGCAINGTLSRDYLDKASCEAEDDSVWHPFQGEGCICEEESGDSCDTDDDRSTCEANEGIWTYFGTDPNNPDTDADGIPDGDDSFPAVPASILRVKLDSNGGNGLTWATAFTNLESAIAEAKDRNSNNISDDNVAAIWVAAGQYKLGDTISLLSNVGIYGGFTGIENKFSQRNPDPFTNDTAIVGQTDNTRRAFYASQVINAVVDGFTISHWNPTIGGGGGAMYIVSSEGIQLRNIHFSKNSSIYGGALRLVNAESFTIEYCVFSDNKSHRSDYRAMGGAIDINNQYYNARITIRYCQFLNNITDWMGGAINISGAIDISNSIFEGNTVGNYFDSNFVCGGAIRFFDADAKLTNCRFSNNVIIGTSAGGGAIMSTTTTLSITGCVIMDNYIRSRSSPAEEVMGSALRIDSSGGKVTFITNCTIVGNKCQGDPTTNGAIYIGSTSGFLYITNSIIADNEYADFNGTFYDGANITTPIDWVQDLSDLQNLLDRINLSHTCIHPIVGELETALSMLGLGDSNIFMEAEDDPFLVNNWRTSGIPRLQSSSPLIDAGYNYEDIDPFIQGIQYLPPIDFAGNPRIVDGNGDGVAQVDIGAYEFQGGMGN